MRADNVNLVSVRWPAIALFCAMTVSPLTSQAWTQVTTGGPPARQSLAMAYDSQRDRTVIFGGDDYPLVGLGDTWEWDGTTWTSMGNFAAVGRSNHALVYDSQRSKTMLFGGSVAILGTALADTWEWNGSTWTQVSVNGPARLHHAMAYDSQRGRTVMFGGSLGLGYLGDTWEWNGSSWTPRTATGPSARSHHAMVYDSQRGRTTLFGGFGWPAGYLSDTWEWDGNTWTQLPATGPPARGGHKMAYDNQRSRTVVFGGVTSSSLLNDTWEWDGIAWTQLPATGPTARRAHAMAYDSLRRRMVLFGGIDSSGRPGGTWELSRNATFGNYGIGCPGSASSTPALGNIGNPILGSTYRITLNNALGSTGAIILTGLSDTTFQNIPLPAPLPNAPGCDLWAAPDAARFTITSTNGTATHAITVPNSASYIGVELFHQWAVFDAANPLGIIVSDAGRARLGN